MQTETPDNNNGGIVLNSLALNGDATTASNTYTDPVSCLQSQQESRAVRLNKKVARDVFAIDC